LQNAGLCYAGPIDGFKSVLPIPPLLDSSISQDGMKRFAFSVDTGETSFFPGYTTPTLGYNGSYLGPTIKVRNGQEVMFKIENNLGEPTTVHWHGLHVPAQWDGGPRQVIEAGETWNPNFRIKQPAATLWYHPHAMGLTGEHVYRGLAGLFIIEDDKTDSLDIPGEYGVDDFPLVLQDRRFFEDGRFAYVQNMMDVMHGVIGNYMLVNGSLWPNLDVPRGMVRLRVLNGSNSSVYRISFSDDRSFHQIATDGGFQEVPVRLGSLLLSAGERAEILVDFAGDALKSKVSLLVDQLAGSRFEAMQFTVGDKSPHAYNLPENLVSIDWLAEDQAVKTRTFRMETMSGGMGMMGRGGRLTINGRNMDLNYINERVKLGDTEIWEIENYSAMMMRLPHSMHLHDVQFQILDRNGSKPSPAEQGRKDTVLVQPGERVRIISRFEDYTGIYMYHCHFLEHEDNGMMGQFEVVA
ncbi:MAG: multicopper oxidase domain-containing protein, partial [Desulfocapsaceae bacterium]|nr:multicopper oxidase domain-containing protein [Desulfocapsaceae bacterium]